MHENDTVVHYNPNDVRIINPKHLPFGLRNLEACTNGERVAKVERWLNARISNLHRSYMNVIYSLKKIGRDNDNILRDSLAVSFTDNFWIKTSDVELDWNEFEKWRDKNVYLAEASLTGKTPRDGYNTEGVTSIFTTKGYYPKSVLNGYIYKDLENSINDYTACLIAGHLSIPCAECELLDDRVKIKIFTSNDKSFVHASDFLEEFDLNANDLMDYFEKTNAGIAEKLKLLCIFNYIIGNGDLHNENFGFLYDPSTFELIDIAPCFDHNRAFDLLFDEPEVCTDAAFFGGSHYVPRGENTLLDIKSITMKYARDFTHLKPLLLSLDFRGLQAFLNQEQTVQLKARIDDVVRLMTQYNHDTGKMK